MEESERQELIEFYHDAFTSAIESGAYEDIEEIWAELAKLEPDNIANFLAMAKELESRRRNSLAGMLFLSLVDLYKKSKNYDARATALKEAARLLPREEELKEEMADYYRELYVGHPLLEEAIKKSGLLRPMTVEETAPRIDVFLRFKEGDIVNHPTGWGMGRVKSINLDDETVSVDFETHKNHSVGLDMAANILETLPPEGFLAQKFADANSLKEKAESDKTGLIKLVLNDLGGKASLTVVKSRLTDGIVSTSEWTKWWASAKKAAMTDPYLTVSRGASAVLELRDKPVSHQDEILEKIAAAGRIEDKIALVDDYKTNLKAAERTSESLGGIANALLEAINGSKDASAVLQVALVLDDLKGLCRELSIEHPDLRPLLAPGSAVEAVEMIGKASYKRRALLRLKELYPDEWPEVFSKTFFEAGSDLWDFAAKELLDAKKHSLLSGVFREVLAKSREHAEACLWLCRSALMGKYPALLGEHNKIDLIERLLGLMNELSRADAAETKAAATRQKKLLTKGRDTISVANFRHLERIVENSSQDEARRVYNAARVCHGLTETARDKITAIVVAEHPALAPAPAADGIEPDVIYTTNEGLRRKEAEFNRVINEEIPENQKALGVAISFGDLSENAEYSAAREQQGILMEKAERIEKELAQAKLIDPNAVRDDIVSIGTAIEIRDTQKGKTERYTILGPWDSDAENGVVSYLAPLAAAFIGKAAGDKAVLNFSEEKPEYEIISITKVI